MNKMKKSGLRRLVAYALVLAMVLTLMPTSAFAAKQPSMFGWLFRTAISQPKAEPAPAEEPAAPAEEPAAEEPEAPAEEPAAEEPEAPAEEPAPEEAPAEEPAEEAEAPAEEPAAEPEAAPAEEPAEEAADAALTEELKVDDLTVSIEAEAGAFPEGVEVKAEKADLADVQKAVDEADDVDGKVLYAVDITFTKDGKELQPAEGKTVKVSFAAADLKEVEAPAVVHIDSETEEAEKIDTLKVEEDGEVAFEAEKFSVYAVVGDGEQEGDSRRTIEFYKSPDDEDPIATMIVRANDPDDQRDKILYDPGVDGLTEGQLFRGWTTNPNYTSETEVLNIEQIRTAAYDPADPIVEGEAPIKYYAVIFTAYSVIYADEEGKTIHSDLVLLRVGTTADYKINQSYTSPNPNASFVGWRKVLGTATPKTPGAQEPYPIDTVLTVGSSIVLQADAPEGKWLIFDSDGGSYVAPQFIVDRESSAYQRVTEEPDDPVRHGYTFQRWIDDEGNTFEFGSALEAQTTVHAEWEENTTANYAVIIWRQRMSDTIAENTGDDKNYDFVEAVIRQGTVGNTITLVTFDGSLVTDGDGAQYPNARVEGVERNSTYDKGYIGYHCAGADQNVVIKSDGTSVVNVYYDRNVVTYTFYSAGGTGYTYTPTTSNSVSPQYAFINGEYVELTAGTGDVYTTTTSNNPAEQYRLLDGEYVPLTRVTQNTYSRAYDTDNSPKKYGLVNGEYVPITRTSRPVPEAHLTTLFAGTHYGLVNGKYVELEERTRWVFLVPIIEWFIVGTNTEYNGTHYSMGTENYWALDSNGAEYTGNFYRVSGTTYSWEYNGQPYTGTRYTKGQGRVWLLNGEPYTGTRYVRGTGPSGWGVYSHEVGYYGETLNWPTDTSYWWYESTAQDATRMTYKNDFLPLDSDMNVSYYGRRQNATGTINFYTQNTALNGYDGPKTVSANGGSFSINDKFAGFEAYQYRTDNGTWRSVGTLNPNTGIYGSAVSYNYRLDIRYNRKVSDITFMDGSYFSDKDGKTPAEETVASEAFGTIRNVAYGADITTYGPGGANEFTPDAFNTGYTFAGWYADKTCTVPYTFGTMPDGGLTLYAKWVQTGYRVFLHPNAFIENDDGDQVLDNSLNWGDSQKMNFYVGYGDSVQNVVGTRDAYEFVGWFRDEALRTPFIPDNIKVADSTVPETPAYNKAEDMTDEMDKFGNIVDPATASNSDVDRPWVKRKLDLYAKWRKTLVGADGINVEYDVGDSNTTVEDQYLYLDGTWVLAQAAPTPNDETMRFLNWEIMKFEDGEFVPTGETVYPGDTFEVLLDNAKAEELTGSTTANPKFKYTVQLRAQYTKKDVPTPTHITFYANNGTWDTVEEYPSTQINEAVDIPFPPASLNPGYDFVGWARFDEAEVEGDEIDPETGDHVMVKKPGYDPEEGKDVATGNALTLTSEEAHFWLKLNEDGQTYTEVGTAHTEVTQVAADEETPYHDLYAVWERKPTFKVVYSSDPNTIYEFFVDAFSADPADDEDERPILDLVKGVDGLTDADGNEVDLPGVGSDKLYGGYQLATLADNTLTPGVFGTEENPGTAIVPEKDQVYYVREVDGSYLKPVYKFSYVKATKRCTGMWVISSVDATTYQNTGFVVDMTAELSDHPSNVRTSMKIKNTTSTITVTPQSAFAHDGYLTYLEVKDLLEGGFPGLVGEDGVTLETVSFKLYPYWTTMDGIPVFGKQGVDITIHPKNDSGKVTAAAQKSVIDSIPIAVQEFFESEEGFGD